MKWDEGGHQVGQVPHKEDRACYSPSGKRCSVVDIWKKQNWKQEIPKVGGPIAEAWVSGTTKRAPVVLNKEYYSIKWISNSYLLICSQSIASRWNQSHRPRLGPPLLSPKWPPERVDIAPTIFLRSLQGCPRYFSILTWTTNEAACKAPLLSGGAVHAPDSVLTAM